MKRSREPEEDSDPVAPGCGDREQGPTTREDTTSSAPAAKIVELDPSSSRGVEMRCSLPPHRETLVFKTYDEFESHHIKAHTNRCLECGKNLPSAHMLDLHHEECHDAFLALKREKGEHTVSSNPIQSIYLDGKLTAAIVLLLRGRLREEMLDTSEAANAFNR
jgi:hypothetical protein